MLIPHNGVVNVCTGDFFSLVLPDGTRFKVELTQDCFSVCRDSDGSVDEHGNPQSIHTTLQKIRHG